MKETVFLTDLQNYIRLAGDNAVRETNGYSA